MGLGSLLTKAVGAYTLYLTMVDTGRFGKAFKNKKPQTAIAKNFPDMYINTQRLNLSETLLPTVVSNAKRGWFNIYLQDTIMPFLNGITGYVQGIATGITHNILPIALGIGALAMSKSGIIRNVKNPVTGQYVKMAFKKVVNPRTGIATFKKLSFLEKNGGKFCAALIALGAAKTFLYNVCGVGQYKKL